MIARLCTLSTIALLCGCSSYTAGYVEPPESRYKLMVEWSVDASLEGQSWQAFDQYMARFGFNATEQPERNDITGFSHRDPQYPHLTSEYDVTLRKNVLRLNIHVTPFLDRDRGETAILDRQRNEIRTIDNNRELAKLHGNYDEWQRVEWKFKLPVDFKPSDDFFHLYQIKAVDGPDRSMPLITLSPKAARNTFTQERMTIYFFGRSGSGNQSTLYENANLNDYKGEWVEVKTETHFAKMGSYSMVITRISDGKVLLEYSNDNIDMWRGGSSYIRCKFGLYRGFGANIAVAPDGTGRPANGIKNEAIWLADFKIYEANTNPTPELPHD